jgi:hypothetical protein
MKANSRGEIDTHCFFHLFKPIPRIPVILLLLLPTQSDSVDRIIGSIGVTFESRFPDKREVVPVDVEDGEEDEEEDDDGICWSRHD